MSQLPTPVEVVRGPKGPGFFRRFIEAIPTAVATSILTAFLLGLFAPSIARYVALFRPTCAEPRGLTEVPPSQIEPTADVHEESDPPSVLVDGRVGNIWVPPMLNPDQRPEGVSERREFAVVDPDASRVELKLASRQDVELVCVVNGLANGYQNYVNWGRVRTVRAWTDDDHSARLSVLKSHDQGSFQTFQDVSVPRGETGQITLEIGDLYEGQQTTSVDPDVCQTRDKVGEGMRNDPIGCNLNATPKAGLAEIKVYRLKEARWKALLPWA